jgi:hypothetical protein
MAFLQQQPHTPIPADSLSKTEYELLQAGDVLLRRGYGWISDYIVAVLEEPCPLTHCGLLVPLGTGWGVLHTASSEQHDGIIVEPLFTYVQQSQRHSLVACRPRCTPHQRTQLLALAQAYRQKAPPFDYSFDDQDAQALYCVELLRDLFLMVCQQDYLPLHYQRGELSLLGFQNFFDNRNFTLLFNHCQPKPPSQ